MPPEFACKTKAGNERTRVSFDGMHITIGDIGDGINQDGTEEQRDAAKASPRIPKAMRQAASGICKFKR